MTRARSKSLVARIALGAPPHSLGTTINKDESEVESHQTNLLGERTKIVRSKSFSLQQHRKEAKEKYILFPFLDREVAFISQGIEREYSLTSYPEIDYLKEFSTANEDIYKFQKCCKANVTKIDNMVQDADILIQSLSGLVLQYNAISQETSEFAEKSISLLEKLKRLDLVSSEIDDYLKIYDSFDSIAKILTSPGKVIVKQQSFREALRKLDSSLNFIEKHPSFKNIDLYELRFRQCMTRALTLIRNYLIDELAQKEILISEKLKQNSDKTYSKSITTALLYTEFTYEVNENESDFSSFPSLVAEIENSMIAHDEYKGLLFDVLDKYFNVRTKLIQSYVMGQVQKLTNGEIEFLQMSQEAISFAHKLVEREYTVFKVYFIKSDEIELPKYILHRAYEWFKRILDPFYNAMRFRIAREKNMSNLCQLINILQKYYAYDENEMESQKIEDDINYENLFQIVVGNAQSRVTLLFHMYIDSIPHYAPKATDFTIGYRRKSGASENISKQDFKPPMLDSMLFSDLYSPVNGALSMLSILYEIVSMDIFEELVKETVANCIKSLKRASSFCRSQKGSLDAELYYLKNLISMKKIILNFDSTGNKLNLQIRIDMTSGLSAIIQTLRDGKFMQIYNNNGGFMELVKQTLPRFVDASKDDEELDTELNRAVLEFLSSTSDLICSTLNLSDTSKSFIERAREFRDSLQDNLSNIYKKVYYYISDKQITEYLVDNLNNLIIITYEEFFKGIELDFHKESRESTQDLALLDADALVNLMADVASKLRQTEDERSTVADLEKMHTQN